jgi:hypothetical protein
VPSSNAISLIYSWRRELIQFTLVFLMGACIPRRTFDPNDLYNSCMRSCVQCPEGMAERKSSPEGRLLSFFCRSASAMHVCGKQGDFDTLRHSSGTLKGEILLWQKTTESMDLHGF